MNTEKMNGLRDQIRNYVRFNIFSPDREATKRKIRNQILEIQETVKFLRPLRVSGRYNHWLESVIKYSLYKQDRLMRKYIRKFNEFPIGISEEVFQ